MKFDAPRATVRQDDAGEGENRQRADSAGARELDDCRSYRRRRRDQKGMNVAER